MKYVSKPFYFGSYLAAFVLSLPFTIGPLIVGKGTIEEEHMPFLIIGVIFGFYAFIVFAILLYKMWKILPSDLARTTPGKAVGFLFIPLFNYYWFFPAIWGWTKDYNCFIRISHPELRQVSQGLGLAIAIFSVLGGAFGLISAFADAPAIVTVFGSLNGFLMLILIYQVCTVLNGLPDEIKETASRGIDRSQEPTGPRNLGIASLILGILSILIPYLGLVLGIVGIVLSSKQRKIRKEAFSLAGLITSIIGTSIWGLTTIIVIVTLIVLSTM